MFTDDWLDDLLNGIIRLMIISAVSAIAVWELLKYAISWLGTYYA